MFLLVIAGAFGGRAYTQLCSGHLSSMWVLAAYYVYLLWSPIMSAFYYNSVLLALLVAALVIRDSPKKSRLIMSTVSGDISSNRRDSLREPEKPVPEAEVTLGILQAE